MKFYKYKAVFIIIVCAILIVAIIEKVNLKVENDKTEVFSQNSLLSKSRADLESVLKQGETFSNIIYKTALEQEKGPNQSSGKVAYITIDDGPSKYTDRILHILKENNVKATFFLIDGRMKTYKDKVNRILDDGNSVGLHSVTHDVKKLYKSPQVTLGEFEKCKDTLLNISGVKSNLIRLPYGSKPYMPKGSYKKLVENNFLIWDWNLDTQDWKSTTDQIVSNVLYYGRERNNLIVLIHEKKQSVEALDGIIKVLKSRGYNLMPIKEEDGSRNYWNGKLK